MSSPCREVYNYDDKEFFEVRARISLHNTSGPAMDFFADLDTLAAGGALTSYPLDPRCC